MRTPAGISTSLPTSVRPSSHAHSPPRGVSPWPTTAPSPTRTYLSRIARSARARGPITVSAMTTESTTSAPRSTRTPGNSTDRRTVPETRQPFATRLSSIIAPSVTSTGGRSSSRVRIGQRTSWSTMPGWGERSSQLER